MAGGSRHAKHGVRAMIPVPVARETGSRRRSNFRKGSQAVHACVNAPPLIMAGEPAERRVSDELW